MQVYSSWGKSIECKRGVLRLSLTQKVRKYYGISEESVIA